MTVNVPQFHLVQNIWGCEVNNGVELLCHACVINSAHV